MSREPESTNTLDPRAPWVVWHALNRIRCDACGDRVKLPRGRPWRIYIAFVEAYIEAHAECGRASSREHDRETGG